MNKTLNLSKQFVYFVTANGLAAIFNFSSRIFFNIYFSYLTSIILAFFIGLSSAYILCKIFVFTPQKNHTLQQMGYFILVNMVALLQTIIISLLFADFLFKPLIHSQELREATAHFIGLSIPIFTSYFGHKYITFR